MGLTTTTTNASRPPPPTPTQPRVEEKKKWQGHELESLKDSKEQPSRVGVICVRVTSAVTLLFSIGLFAFTCYYNSGAFHFETFIGPIGPNVFTAFSCALIFASSITLVSSFSV